MYYAEDANRDYKNLHSTSINTVVSEFNKLVKDDIDKVLVFSMIINAVKI